MTAKATDEARAARVVTLTALYAHRAEEHLTSAVLAARSTDVERNASLLAT